MTFWTSELFLRKEGKLIKIEKPDDANASDDREWLFFELRSAWNVGGKTYPAGALLATELEGFLKGERKFDVLFEPHDRKSLADSSTSKHHVLLNELDNVRNRLYVLTHKEGKWQREELPGAPPFSTVAASPVDPDESDDYLMTVTGYLTPTSLYFGTLGKGPPEKLKQSPAFFNTEGFASQPNMRRNPKTARAIPYFQVARKDFSLNGENPTLLYGYGGFEVSMVPGYQARDRIRVARGGGSLRRGEHPRRRRNLARNGIKRPSSKTATKPTRISSRSRKI